ncbi:MAG: vitamin K epoxide reductase family protein [Bdellovibrionota bacterium]
MTTKINVPTILIGIAGFFVSLYALILHIQNLMQPGQGTLCDISAKFNCSSVIGSSYGELASIPLGSYGMAYFVIILSAAVLPKISTVTKKQLAQLEFYIGLIGFISVVALLYISHFILKTICPTCSVIHLLTVAYFVIKVVTLIKNRKTHDTVQSDYFIRFIAVCICLGIPPLACGLVAPIIIDKFFSTPKKTTAAALQSETPVEISINKTNYVGNGEDYRRGKDDAKAVVQVFSDFGCPHCKESNAPLLQAQDRVGLDKVLIVYRFFPLDNKCNPYVPGEGWYPYSCILPQATRCAGLQNKFWEFKEWAFSGQNWTDEQRAQSFNIAGLKEEAKGLGMNVDAFAQCVENEVELNKIKEDAALANRLKIKGTPMILINGKEYSGPHLTDDFTRAFIAAQD